MATNRIKKSFTVIPECLADTVKFLAGIGEKQRRINAIKLAAKIRVDAINEKAKQEITVITHDRNNLFNALFAFAGPRKVSLTLGIRSVFTSQGAFGWRMTPPAVTFASGMTEMDMIRHLERNKLTQFVRVIKEVDREELLKQRPVIKHISYTQRDEFYAKPTLAKGEGKSEELTRPVTEAIDVLKQ